MGIIDLSEGLDTVMAMDPGTIRQREIGLLAGIFNGLFYLMEWNATAHSG